MEPIEIEMRLLRLLTQYGDQLPPEQVEDMKELVAAGESGVALENFSTQLIEYDVFVPTALVTEIQELSQAMNLDEKYWKRLSK